jgi:hypothetical protein
VAVELERDEVEPHAATSIAIAAAIASATARLAWVRRRPDLFASVSITWSSSLTWLSPRRLM